MKGAGGPGRDWKKFMDPPKQRENREKRTRRERGCVGEMKAFKSCLFLGSKRAEREQKKGGKKTCSSIQSAKRENHN